MRRTLSIACALAALAAPAGRAAGDVALLTRHAPLLVLHPQERFAPTAVDGFLGGSDVLVRTSAGWQPQTGPLPTGPGTFRLDVRGCAPDGGPATVDCYAAAPALAAEQPVVYGAVHRRASRIALQYWLFYPYNFWTPLVPGSEQFWQAHEGDWEHVTVVLDGRERPLFAAAGRHCRGVRRDWAGVRKRGVRPLVYVSLGSHANGFAPGTAVVDPACWPNEAVAIYRAYGVRMLDHAASGRTVAPRVARVTAASPAWMRFGGTWGEDQFSGFPNYTFRFGAGPTGPAFKTAWRDPIGTALRWPRG